MPDLATLLEEGDKQPSGNKDSELDVVRQARADWGPDATNKEIAEKAGMSVMKVKRLLSKIREVDRKYRIGDMLQVLPHRHDKYKRQVCTVT